jgi:hypothetical protein
MLEIESQKIFVEFGICKKEVFQNK